MAESNWKNLLVDIGAVALPLDESRFRQWMSNQRVFVSSIMDGELTPYRHAVRTYLAQFGPGVAMMWETLSPQDIAADTAYLSGVDRSTLFVLLLGLRYGVAAASGYSPTHQEANHAKERHVHRLLFTLPVTSDSARDGKLNDWLRSLYNEVAGNAVADPNDVIAQLDARLREFAARAERNWIKLGRCVFPGRVEMATESRGARSFRVVARAHGHDVRRQLHAMGGAGAGELRLSWPNESYPVMVERVQQTSEFVGEADIEITCRTPQNLSGGSMNFQNMTVNGVGADEQARRWAQHAIFGVLLPTRDQRDMLGLWGVQPDGPSLPVVLSATRATGWLAEGLVRLYAVEEVARTRGGQFTSLAIGPATATGVRIEGEFLLENYGQQSNPVRLDGVVPLGNK